MKHYVIISSSYSSGTRIALDITIEGKSDKQKVIDVSKQILDSCGKDTPIATHLIDTTSSSWKSVIEAEVVSIRWDRKSTRLNSSHT